MIVGTLKGICGKTLLKTFTIFNQLIYPAVPEDLVSVLPLVLLLLVYAKALSLVVSSPRRLAANAALAHSAILETLRIKQKKENYFHLPIFV